MAKIVSFRCQNCGHLHEADHAGENDVPHACCVCGAGVIQSPKLKALANEIGQADCPPERRMAIANEMRNLGDDRKQLDPSNWEVLSECTDARLHELGLDHDCVCKHEPKVKSDPQIGRNVEVLAVDGPMSKDK